MKSLIPILLLTSSAYAAEPLLKPVAVPQGSTRVVFPLEGPHHHLAAQIGKFKDKQTGSGEKFATGTIALGTFMQAPAIATVKRLESLGYKTAHQQVVTIPEVILVGRALDAKGKTAEVKVKLTNLKVLALLYVFVSDDDALGADLWIRVDQLLGGTTLAQAQPRVWLGEEKKSFVCSYPSRHFTKTDDDKAAVAEPAPTGPGEGEVKVTMALTGNYTMPGTRLNNKPFFGNPKPVAGFTIHNTYEKASLTASLGLMKMFDLKKVNDGEGPRIFGEGREIKMLNGRTSDLRFALEGTKTPMEWSALEQDLLLDQETEQPILWVGPGYLDRKISHLTLAGESTGWKLTGFAKSENVTAPVKAKK